MAQQVFISYSRKDRVFADTLRTRLQVDQLEARLDEEDIAKGEPWEARLRELIESADVILFLMSPDWLASPVCQWELGEALALSKRVLPVMCRPMEPETIPPALRRLNFTYLDGSRAFEAELERLICATRENFDWIREHTRLGELALRWDRANRPPRLLLRGDDIAAAEGWRDTRTSGAPEITPLQGTFIASSRRSVDERQKRWLMAGAVVLTLMGALTLFALRQQAVALNGQSVAVARDVLQMSGSRRADEAKASPELATLVAIEQLDRIRASLPARWLGKDPAELEAALYSSTARLGAADTLFESPESLESIMASRSGETVVTCARKKCFVIDAVDHTSREIAVPAAGLHLTADGSGLITVRANGIVVEDPVTGRQLASRGVPGGIAQSRLDNTQGQFLVLDRASRDVCSFAALTLEPRGCVTAGAKSFVQSADGRTLVTLEDDSSGRLYRNFPNESSFERLQYRAEGSSLFKDDLAVSPHGHYLAIPDGVSVILKDTAGKDPDHTLRGYDRVFSDLVFSPDETMLAATSIDATTRLWFTGTGFNTATLTGHTRDVYRAIFSEDGRLLVTASDDGTLRVWDAKTRQFIRELSGHAGPVRDFVILSDVGYILSASRDGTIRRWPMHRGHWAGELVGHTNYVDNVALSPDARLALTSSRDLTVRLWDLQARKELRRWESEGMGLVRFSTDGAHAAIVVGPKALVLDGKTWNTELAIPASDRLVTGIAFQPGGDLLALGTFDNIEIWKLRERRRSRLLTETGAFWSGDALAFSAHGGYFIARAFAQAYIYDSRDFSVLAKTAESPLIVAAVSNDERLAVLGTEAEGVFVTDLRRRTGRRALAAGKPWSSARGAALSPDGELLVVSFEYGTSYGLEALSVRDGSNLWRIERSPEKFGEAQFTPDGKHVVVEGDNGNLRVVDAATGIELDRFEPFGFWTSELAEIALSSDGKVLLTAGYDEDVRIWKFLPRGQALIDCARNALPAGKKRLTPAEQRQAYGGTDAWRWRAMPTAGKSKCVPGDPWRD